MPEIPKEEQRFEQYKVCVLLPTYNNAKTVASVIEGILDYTSHLIIINDGSTDETGSILQQFPGIETISYSPNQGKGMALRRGFRRAIEKGYQYAITIDSDGQHFPTDIPLFLDKLENEGPALIMGARNMEQAGIPGKSSFGHKFSNFWYRVETGIDCPDTQTGFRLYPLLPMKSMRFFTRKYELEIESIVRLAWKGVAVHSVPITVYYPPGKERITHFRPFRDFSRISILNTILVLISFLYIRPRNFFRYLFTKRNWRKELKTLLLNPEEPDWVKAVSAGFGVFMGIVPIWGFQLIVAIALAVLFRLNKAIVILTANISIPPMIPLIIFVSYKMGAYWMGDRAVELSFSRDLNLETIRLNLEQYLYGSITLAILGGLAVMILLYIILRLTKRKPSPPLVDSEGL